jgi:hypothetical protein
MVAWTPCLTKISPDMNRIGAILWTSQSDTLAGCAYGRHLTTSLRCDAIVKTAATMITRPLMTVWV